MRESSDDRDFYSIVENMVCAKTFGTSVVQHLTLCINSTLNKVKNEDGSIRPVQEREDWKTLVL